MGGWSTPFRRALSPLGSRAASAAEVRRLSCASAAKAGFSSDDVAAVRLNRLRKNPWQWGKTADPSPLKRFGMTNTGEVRDDKRTGGVRDDKRTRPVRDDKNTRLCGIAESCALSKQSQSEFFSSLQGRALTPIVAKSGNAGGKAGPTRDSPLTLPSRCGAPVPR